MNPLHFCLTAALRMRYDEYNKQNSELTSRAAEGLAQ